MIVHLAHSEHTFEEEEFSTKMDNNLAVTLHVLLRCSML